jgi:YihY family inner membrane protein
LISKFREHYQNVNHASGGRLLIIKHAIETFSETRASQSAASLAYYSFFSLFPLLLVLIAGGSYFLSREQIYQNVTRLVQEAIPISTELINANLRQVLDARGTVGLIGLLTLLWSASGFFTNLAHSINLAWSDAPRRNFLERRLISLGMIAGLCGLLIISLSLDWLTNLAPFPRNESASSSTLGLCRLFSGLGSWLTIFLLFLALYRWIPTADVYWSAIFWGALTASVAWNVATAGFSWYLRSGLGRYQLVYGSLGAIVALLFLIFIVSTITLFGAHLCAAVDRWEKGKR